MPESFNYRFRADLKKFFQLLEVRFDKGMARIALDLHDRIVMRNPVDTGRSRASWTIGIGQPDTTAQPATFSGGAAAGTAKAQEQRKKLIGVRGGVAQKLPVRQIWIANHVPYIVKLEFGHSKQAPHGMARISVAEIAAEVRATIEKLS